MVPRLDASPLNRHAYIYMATDPVLIAYTVKRTDKDNRAVWTRIGQAYSHEEGAGLTVVLDSLPFDGRIVLIEPDHADDQLQLARALRKVK